MLYNGIFHGRITVIYFPMLFLYNVTITPKLPCIYLHIFTIYHNTILLNMVLSSHSQLEFMALLIFQVQNISCITLYPQQHRRGGRAARRQTFTTPASRGPACYTASCGLPWRKPWSWHIDAPRRHSKPEMCQKEAAHQNATENDWAARRNKMQRLYMRLFA